LVVDDAPQTLEILQRNLEAEGFETQTASNVPEAIGVLERAHLDLVVTDIKMPGSTGLDLTRFVRQNCRATAVMVITGYPSVDGAVQAVKLGAEEYLAKPFTAEELAAAVRRALRTLERRQLGSAPRARDTWAERGVIGCCPEMVRVLEAAASAARRSSPVVLEGELGTGKALLARAIHDESGAHGPFLAFDCGSAGERAPAEVFGARRGSPCLARAARGGTLYLTRLEESRPLQARLAGALAARTARALPRLMIGIEDDLPQLVQRGGIAAGLVQSALRIKLPPLRERGEDLPALVTRFLRLDAAGRALVFTDAAMQTLQRHTWPQNLRELRRTLRDLAARVTGDVVDAPDLPAHMRFRLPPSDDASLRRPLADVEAEHIRAVLLAEGGNKARTAEVLRIDRKTLRDKLRRYGIGRGD
jgi:DNA-binding NtrC family response regulator